MLRYRAVPNGVTITTIPMRIGSAPCAVRNDNLRIKNVILSEAKNPLSLRAVEGTGPYDG